MRRSNRWFNISLGMSWSLALIALTTRGADNMEQTLAEIKAGKLRQAKASWWGFDAKDATRCLRAAVDSGVKKLIIDNTGSDWGVGPIKLKSDQEIVIEDGVVIRAKKGEFKGTGDCLFELAGCENVILRGEGDASLIMNKSDYQDSTQYQSAEHRHTLRIFNSSNIKILNLTLKSSGGDGVYIGGKSKDILLENVRCDDHHRQGISVTGAENLLMRNCAFTNTKGISPQCGIDFEPNYASWPIVNCVAENCDFSGNAMSGVSLNFHTHDATSQPVSITLRNCRVNDNKYGLYILSTGEGTPSQAGKLEFINCEFSGNRQGAVVFREHKVGNLTILFKDCVINNQGSKAVPIMISSWAKKDLHGIVIDGLSVVDDVERPPIEFNSRFGNAMTNAVVKDVMVKNNDGREAVFDGGKFLKESAPSRDAKMFATAELDLKKLEPLRRQRADIGDGAIRYRGKFNYLVYAEPGQNIKMKFTNIPVYRWEDKRARDPLSVVAYSPSLAVVDQLKIPFDETVDYTLKATERGIYQFDADARIQTLRIDADAPGGVMASEPLKILLSDGQLFFYVPTGASDVRIEVSGAPGEEPSVSLIDPNGREVASLTKVKYSGVLKHTRVDASKGEVWSVKFAAPKLFLRIGAPSPPVFSSNPTQILIPKPEN